MTPTFTPSRAFPFLVVVIDELAFLTAYQPERDLRKRAEAVRVRAGHVTDTDIHDMTLLAKAGDLGGAVL